MAGEISEFMDLSGKKTLDVGGARGEFSSVLAESSGAEAYNIDKDLFAHGRYKSDFVWKNSARAVAQALPFKDGEFDLVSCRGVLEHIPLEFQEKSVREMFRVTKDGGYCYIMVPPWFSPHGGHGLKPFHILPFRVARFLRHLFFSNRVTAKTYAEAGLFPITVRRMLAMIKICGFTVAAMKDMHFRLHFLTYIPIIREVLVPSVVFILRKEKSV
jgi:ubiquinone/menaquinone biosynthesis C-methylase UbiE